MAGELGRDDAALLDGSELALFTDDDLTDVLGGLLVRVGVGSLLTGVDGLEKLVGRVDGIVARPVGVDGRIFVLPGAPADLVGVEGLARGCETGVEGRAMTLELGVDDRTAAFELEERGLREIELVELDRDILAFVGCCKPRFPRTIRDDGSALEGGSDLEFPSLDIVLSGDLTMAVPLKENPLPARSWSRLGMRGVVGGVKSQS